MKCLYKYCNNDAEVRGYCGKHYRKMLRSGELEKIEKQPEICKHPGCERKSVTKGLCAKHYQRLRLTDKTWLEDRPKKEYNRLTGIEAGPEVIRIMKVAAFGKGISIKQLVRNAVNRYIKDIYDIDISLIEQPEVKAKKENIEIARKMI